MKVFDLSLCSGFLQFSHHWDKEVKARCHWAKTQPFYIVIDPQNFFVCF